MAFQPKRPAQRAGTHKDAPQGRGAALATAIADVTRGMPTTGTRRKPGPPPASAEPLVQVNFRCSATMARSIAEGARQAGTTRQFLARFLRDSGLPVAESDLAPATPLRGRT